MAAMAAVIAIVITGGLIWVITNGIKRSSPATKPTNSVSKPKRQPNKKQQPNAMPSPKRTRRTRTAQGRASGQARSSREGPRQKAREQAEDAERTAIAAKQAAETAKAAEEYEAYVARIGLAAAKVEENAFGDVAALLDECPPELRNWEWADFAFSAAAPKPRSMPRPSSKQLPSPLTAAVGCRQPRRQGSRLAARSARTPAARDPVWRSCPSPRLVAGWQNIGRRRHEFLRQSAPPV